MGVRILEDRDTGEAVLYCSTTCWAFGPVFQSAEEAASFIDWDTDDPRQYSSQGLESAYSRFRKERTCQWCATLLEHPMDENHEEIEDKWQCPDPKCKGRKDPCPSQK
ncbi:MAG: hypothetical protein LN413_00165 [Candidatus Thermoplasmatota archaeon]|nr:hypothetical protein [Candidatus Thermoplasmatota archaeon]